MSENSPCMILLLSCLTMYSMLPSVSARWISACAKLPVHLKINSNFWLLSSWNSWLQVVVEWKICLEELLGKHNEDGTCWEKKFHLRFTKFRKILPIHFSAKKIKSYRKLESKCIFSICMFDLQIIVTFPRSGKWNDC